ncbi:MAG: hypothetical protein ACREU5_02865 [Burkholderiales bacterium]
MATSHGPDPLAELLRKIETWCTEAQVNLIFGELDEDDAKTQIVRFDAQTAKPDDEYLTLLHRLRPSAVIVDVLRLSDERWQALDNLRNVTDPTDHGDVLKNLERLRPNIGYIVSMTFYAFVAQPALILSHEIFAPWSDALAALQEHEEEISPIEEEETDPEAKQRNTEFAQRLARHARFPKARNFEKRCYLAKLLFKDENLSDEDVMQIVREAEIIYDVEIKT